METLIKRYFLKSHSLKTWGWNTTNNDDNQVINDRSTRIHRINGKPMISSYIWNDATLRTLAIMYYQRYTKTSNIYIQSKHLNGMYRDDQRKNYFKMSCSRRIKLTGEINFLYLILFSIWNMFFSLFTLQKIG